MNRFDADFADIEYPLMHHRTYDVRGYHVGGTVILLRAVIDDQGAADTIVPGDPDPLTLHHMVVDARVDLTTTLIESLDVRFETWPHGGCETIAGVYQQLVGAEMGRGWTNRVRELFGGPRGCTHVGALLLAMAPIVAQARWPVFGRIGAFDGAENSTERRRSGAHFNLNTCHTWAEDSNLMQRVARGDAVPIPMPIARRMDELGVDRAGPFRRNEP